jgi:NADH-quinone oxidoreductase subunit L
MFRLMSMTFFGAYRGPAWETSSHAAVVTAAVHGATHPADAHAHGQAHRKDHEVTHGPAEPHDHSPDQDDAHGHRAADDAGHGHGPWHGPHESPTPMTFPLMVLAVGALVAGFVGIPAALGGPNALEHFLEPSFTAEARPSETGAARVEPGSAARPEAVEAGAAGEHGEPHVSRGVELGLMAFSLVVAIAGISLAYKFYVVSPEIAEGMRERFAGAHRTLSHKYYVDELYNATVVAGTFGAARELWRFDRRAVDGAVNGTGRLTIIGSWLSGLTDRRVVDGAVNFVGWVVQESSLSFRRVQTGLLQNYAMLMLFGIFAFVGIYLFVR